MGDYNILFPSVDSKQAMTLMKKHICAIESSIINYHSDDDTNTCEPRAVMYSSNIRPTSLEIISRTFKILYDFMMVEALVDAGPINLQKEVSQSTGSN